jgi:hypothetical protein
MQEAAVAFLEPEFSPQRPSGVMPATENINISSEDMIRQLTSSKALCRVSFNVPSCVSIYSTENERRRDIRQNMNHERLFLETRRTRDQPRVLGLRLSAMAQNCPTPKLQP